ncbi:MCE family protein [Nocardioides maradonensis]
MRRRVVLGVVALLLLGGVLQGARVAGWLGGTPGDDLVVTADFVDTTGLYVGNQVTYLGVPVGTVVDVEPRGASMRVVLHLQPGTQVPADAGAEILQSSLVTDRYVELGPAYTGGPTLASGAHITAAHTRSPAGVDEIATAIDNLVKALNGNLRTGRGTLGSGLGTLLATTAKALRGNGTALRSALSNGQGALQVLTSKDAALTQVSNDLRGLVDVLARRDRRIRTFTRQSDATLGVLAGQSGEIAATMKALDRLSVLGSAFLRRNAGVLGQDLAGVDDIVGIVRRHQASLAEAFDDMPTLAQNYAQAYDWKTQRLRVQFSFAAGPFSSLFRAHTCQLFAAALPGAAAFCDALDNPDGTGLLDGILDGLYNSLPGNTP